MADEELAAAGCALRWPEEVEVEGGHAAVEEAPPEGEGEAKGVRTGERRAEERRALRQGREREREDLSKRAAKLAALGALRSSWVEEGEDA